MALYPTSSIAFPEPFGCVVDPLPPAFPPFFLHPFPAEGRTIRLDRCAAGACCRRRSVAAGAARGSRGRPEAAGGGRWWQVVAGGALHFAKRSACCKIVLGTHLRALAVFCCNLFA